MSNANFEVSEFSWDFAEDPSVVKTDMQIRASGTINNKLFRATFAVNSIIFLLPEEKLDTAILHAFEAQYRRYTQG